MGISVGILILTVLLFTPSNSKAANGADFQAGRIIDDAVFTNKAAMSVGDIQNFLNSKVPTCDTYHPAGPSAQGAQPPWTCLKDYSEGGRSAAQIIYDAAQTYTINPRVILVTLQKENGLIADTWPYPWQYRTAMGFGCPDGAPCDAQWFGFANQVNQGARHFRGFFDNSLTFVPYRPGNNFIQYNPNSGCGGTTINIQNRATAALYSYTPYQPNAAALNNINGSGDGCSAYGNRNFWRDYTDWFGSTFGAPYASSYAGQSAYPSVSVGSTAQAYMRFQNSGNIAWYDADAISSAPSGTKPVTLATSRPINRSSAVGYPWGGDRNRVVGFGAVYESNGTTLAADQNVAQPGQIVQFNITFGAASTTPAGTYREYFQPIVEGGSTMNDPGTFLDVTVAGVYESAYSSQGAYPSIKPSERVTSYIAYRNSGNITWYDDISIYGAPSGTKPIHLATSRTLNRTSAYGSTWGGDQNRPRGVFSAVYESNGTTLAANQNIVQPGQIAKFNIEFSAPANAAPASSREYFQPIVEGGSTMNDPGTFIDVTIPSVNVAAATSAQVTSLNMAAGSSASLANSFINTGNLAWSSGSVYLAPVLGTSAAQFRHTSWVSNGNIVAVSPSSIAPGSSGSFSFSITAPTIPGVYNIEFAPAVGGSTFGSPNAKYKITVAAPTYISQYAGQSAYPAFKAGTSQSAHLRYKNLGNIAWYDADAISSAPSGTKPVTLATSRPINRSSAVGYPWGGDRNRVVGFGAVYESNGTTLAADQNVAQPGQIVQFNITFGAASTTPAGTYREYFQPIVEGGSTMNDPGTFLDVTVQQQVYASEYAGQCPYPQMIAANTSANCFLRYKNVGNMTWYDGTTAAASGARPVNLATSRGLNRFSLVGTLWGGDQNRAATIFGSVYESNGTTLASEQHIVQPGQIVQYNFQLWAAEILPAGTYREYFQPIVESGSTMNDPGTFIDVRITRP